MEGWVVRWIERGERERRQQRAELAAAEWQNCGANAAYFWQLKVTARYGLVKWELILVQHLQLEAERRRALLLLRASRSLPWRKRKSVKGL